VDQIKQAINKKNEENQTKSNSTDDNFQINYSIKVLKQIKTKFIDDEPAKLINEIINNFCIQSKINKDDFIDLLINKTKRNYETHGIIDDFIDALIDDQYTEDQVIQYLEVQNDVTLMINSKEKDIIIKLLQVNIIHRKNQLMKLVVDKKITNI
jgi:hypothetical protein